MYAARLANATFVRAGGTGMRFIVDANIHEALDSDCEIRILDVVGCEHWTAKELLLLLEDDYLMESYVN